MMKIIAFVFCLFVIHANGQSIERSVIGSSGGSFSNSNLNVQWTIGETVVSTLSAGSILLTQGFHQYNSNSSSIVSILHSNIEVYPNPTENLLHFKMNNSIEMAEITMTDINGKTVKTELWNTMDSHTIDISNLAPGVYHANIKIGNSFGIVKICKL